MLELEFTVIFDCDKNEEFKSYFIVTLEDSISLETAFNLIQTDLRCDIRNWECSDEYFPPDFVINNGFLYYAGNYQI